MSTMTHTRKSIRAMLDTRAVYRFERICESAFPKALTRDAPMAELQMLAARIWAERKREGELYVRANTGTSHDGKKISYCETGRVENGYAYADIVLARHERRPYVLLHEMAHALGHHQHGPSFVHCYSELLVEYGGMDRATLVDMMLAGGVRL